RRRNDGVAAGRRLHLRCDPLPPAAAADVRARLPLSARHPHLHVLEAAVGAPPGGRAGGRRVLPAQRVLAAGERRALPPRHRPRVARRSAPPFRCERVRRVPTPHGAAGAIPVEAPGMPGRGGLPMMRRTLRIAAAAALFGAGYLTATVTQ